MPLRQYVLGATLYRKTNIFQILNRLFIIVIHSKFLYINIFKIYIKFLDYNFIYIIDEFVLLLRK